MSTVETGAADAEVAFRPQSTGSAPVISAYGVSKRFNLHKRKATSLKERLVSRDKDQVDRELWALKDVSLEVGKGETVGLIGHNGSGKSTLLKVISGILRPNAGSAHVDGRIASLLELGAGFNTELSGRDNVYLNASLLGLTRGETDELFDQIVDFSELGNRIDDPVKVYSSGMYVKLGFSVAVHVDPDVLLVDEVLSVGDEAFQEKCIDVIERFQAEGRTILFVSHSLSLVEKLCNRAIVLDHGEVQYDGTPEQAVRVMRGLIGTGERVDLEAELAPVVPELPRQTFHGVTIADQPGGSPKDFFEPGQPFNVRVEVVSHDHLGGDVTCVVMGYADLPVMVFRSGTAGGLPPHQGHHVVDFTLPAMPAITGPYSLAVTVTDVANGRTLAHARFDDCFHVAGDTADGLIALPYDVAVSTARW